MDIEDELQWEKELLEAKKAEFQKGVDKYKSTEKVCEKFLGVKKNDLMTGLIIGMVLSVLIVPFVFAWFNNIDNPRTDYRDMQDVDEVQVSAPAPVNSYKESTYVIDQTKTIREQDVTNYNCGPVAAAPTSCYENCGKFWYGKTQITYAQYQNNCDAVREVVVIE